MPITHTILDVFHQNIVDGIQAMSDECLRRNLQEIAKDISERNTRTDVGPQYLMQSATMFDCNMAIVILQVIHHREVEDFKRGRKVKA